MELSLLMITWSSEGLNDEVSETSVGVQLLEMSNNINLYGKCIIIYYLYVIMHYLL